MFKSSFPSLLPLKHVKKYVTTDGNVSAKTSSAEDTLSRINPVCKKIGVTRISDITSMDRLFIPNYSVVLPGTEDSIWVYGGKGPTKIQARTSALMESIERYCSLSSTYSGNLIQGTYSQLTKMYNKVLHPDEVVEPVERTFDDENSIIDFLLGFDLIKNEDVLVPAQLVFSKFVINPPSVAIFPFTHTNGLASGNVIEEAICHALCEVIERDAASISDLCASAIPYSILTNISNRLQIGRDLNPIYEILENKFVDDASIYPDVNISQIVHEFNSIKFLVTKFVDAGICLLIKDITQKDIGIPTFVASSVEWITDDYGYFAKGYGTHPDSRIALIRAITELSQTRAANIQGARDDFKKINYKEHDEIYKRKWQFMPASLSPIEKIKNKTVLFSEIKSYLNNDILNDLKLILNRLRKAGLKRVIIVDLTNPNIGIPVVRAIVPGLETFEVAKLFTATELFMGRRAKKHFREIHPYKSQMATSKK